MIDIRQLHIGAHIEFYGKRIRIDALSNGEEDALIQTKDAIDGIWKAQLARKFDPIPITEELLKELGFEQFFEDVVPNFHYWKIILNGYPIEITYWGEERNSKGKEWSVHIDNEDCVGIGGMDVQYLHELENFVFLCTGEELIEEEI